MAFAPNGDLFVATRQGVVAMWDGDRDGVVTPGEHALLGGRELSNHGIAFSPDGAWLYYSSGPAVMRIPYRPGLRSDNQAGEVVIPDLPMMVPHPYKTLTFDREGRLYVQVGSRDTHTPGEGAAILRYTIPTVLPRGGIRYASGEPFALGLRNAEALAWDREGRLWAFDNGADFVRPAGTPEGFYLDHPGDAVFRLSREPGRFHGYPYCWLLGPVPWGDRTDPMSFWAMRELDEPRPDAWCQDRANVEPAAGWLYPHTAPLAAVQYTGELFPPEYRGNILVASHGSWNRHTAQIGRGIIRVVIDGERVARVEPLIGERASGGNLHQGWWHIRPAGIAQGPDGAVYFSSDETGDVFRVGYMND